MRYKEPGAESFITAVHAFAEHCSYGVLKELTRDRTVVASDMPVFQHKCS